MSKECSSERQEDVSENGNGRRLAKKLALQKVKNMSKWRKKVTLEKEELKNYIYFLDNEIL